MSIYHLSGIVILQISNKQTNKQTKNTVCQVKTRASNRRFDRILTWSP